MPVVDELMTRILNEMNKNDRAAEARCFAQVMNASGETVQAECRNAGL